MNKVIKDIGKSLVSVGSTMLSIQFYIAIVLIIIIVIGLVIFNIMYKEPKTQDPEPLRLSINIIGTIFLISIAIFALFTYFASKNPYIAGIDAAATGASIVKDYFN